MKNLKYRVIIFTMMLVEISSAKDMKRSTITEEKVFAGYFNQTRLSTRFGLWMDIHHRTVHQFIVKPHQSLGRLAITFFVSDNLRIMAGYCLAYSYPSHALNFSRLEHRPWQQLFYKTHFNKVHSVQMLRLEERYIQAVSAGIVTDDYVHTNRLRYSHILTIPFKKKGMVRQSFSGVLNNEVFINFGKNVKANVFDQNRVFIGLGYQFNKSTALHAGYMNIIQQLPSGYDFINSHCIRFFLFQSFDLRKSK